MMRNKYIKVSSKLIKLAEELMSGGGELRLKRYMVNEENFPILKFLNWEFIEEDEDGGGYVEFTGKSDKEIVSIVEEKTGLPIGSVGFYIREGERGVEFYYVVDSEKLMKENFEKDEELTAEIQRDFEEHYEGGSWIGWIVEWLKERGFTVEEEAADNTYNWDWNGSVFELVPFFDSENNPKLVVMWHLGGDVRGSYSYPEVWDCDFREFISMHGYGDEEEMLGVLGYDDMEDLLNDLEILRTGYDVGGKLEELERGGAEEEGQLRLFD